jgi:hypothetical protein
MNTRLRLTDFEKTNRLIGVDEDGRRTTEACHRILSPSARWLLRVGVDEDGRRTWRPVHRSSSPIARWLLFVVKGFSNFGSRRMRSDAWVPTETMLATQLLGTPIHCGGGIPQPAPPA